MIRRFFLLVGPVRGNRETGRVSEEGNVLRCGGHATVRTAGVPAPPLLIAWLQTQDVRDTDSSEILGNHILWSAGCGKPYVMVLENHKIWFSPFPGARSAPGAPPKAAPGGNFRKHSEKCPPGGFSIWGTPLGNGEARGIRNVAGSCTPSGHCTRILSSPSRTGWI